MMVFGTEMFSKIFMLRWFLLINLISALFKKCINCVDYVPIYILYNSSEFICSGFLIPKKIVRCAARKY